MIREEGFAGQISVVLPEHIRKVMRQNSVVGGLFLTDIGYYPKARLHYRARKSGAAENILIYVVEGEGKVGFEDKSWTVTKDQFVVIPRNTPHWYRANDENPWTIYWVHFMGVQSGFMDSLTGKVNSLSPSPFSRIKERLQLFDEIIEILSLGFSPDNLEYANLCLGHLLASFRYVDQYRKINYAGEKDLVKKVIVYMKQQIHKNIDLKELAAFVGMSVSHFSRLFKQRTRHSPLDYFIRLKMQHACQLLDYSSLKVYEIANALGYADVYYFSRIFKKVMGLSPSGYRKIGKD